MYICAAARAQSSLFKIDTLQYQGTDKHIVNLVILGTVTPNRSWMTTLPMPSSLPTIFLDRALQAIQQFF
jgi:hypothetical protein